MISRTLSRRLERLEEQVLPSAIQHVITVTYVNVDGSATGEGYRSRVQNTPATTGAGQVQLPHGMASAHEHRCRPPMAPQHYSRDCEGSSEAVPRLRNVPLGRRQSGVSPLVARRCQERAFPAKLTI
jgi:hypothetical protein